MKTHLKNRGKDRVWLFVAFLSMCALLFGELFEQIVFVPNWLIGDVPTNMMHFREFKHTTDPGMYYFPIAIIVIISHIRLLFKSSFLTIVQKKAVKTSLLLFSIVFVITIFVIVGINIPVIDQGSILDEQYSSKLTLWAILNMIRIILPAYALYKLSTLFTLNSSSN
ncbi:hypothetical protein WAK64_13520 [Bacillus spongiae]|uniref:DUF2569 domain-containing protein n=1 Tax=Bacillus spongiae TaxID=2683610 RepID=A0ABU8HG14_9BACI